MRDDFGKYIEKRNKKKFQLMIRTRIIILAILLFGNFLSHISISNCKILKDEDLPEIAKKIVVAEIMAQRYDDVYQGFTNPVDTIVHVFERLCTDSIYRENSLLPKFDEITIERMRNIDIESVHNGLPLNNRDSIRVLEVVAREDTDIIIISTGDPRKYFAMAMDFKGNFFPLEGFRKNEIQNLYKSYFNILKNDDNKLDFVLLYLHYIERFELNMIGTDDNVEKLKIHYAKIRVPEFDEGYGDGQSLSISAVHMWISDECRYETRNYYFSFYDDKFEVSYRVIFVHEDDKPCE